MWVGSVEGNQSDSLGGSLILTLVHQTRLRAEHLDSRQFV